MNFKRPRLGLNSGIAVCSDTRNQISSIMASSGDRNLDTVEGAEGDEGPTDTPVEGGRQRFW